ncbi:MAG: hypothetical protein H6735_22940 [Alphaproteobacteria bacterium]|nr:hypothetical protein [Alphaproteobacteria bacterium]
MLTLFATWPALATTTVPLDEADLVGLSERVLLGTIMDVRPEPWASSGVLATRIELDVDEVWKGPDDHMVIFWQAGSEEGGVWVAGAVHYEPGQQVLVFLERSPSGVLVTAGLALGALSAEGGKLDELPVPTGLGASDPEAPLAPALPFRGLTTSQAHARVWSLRDAPWPDTVPSDLSKVGQPVAVPVIP